MQGCRVTARMHHRCRPSSCNSLCQRDYSSACVYCSCIRTFPASTGIWHPASPAVVRIRSSPLERRPNLPASRAEPDRSDVYPMRRPSCRPSRCIATCAAPSWRCGEESRSRRSQNPSRAKASFPTSSALIRDGAMPCSSRMCSRTARSWDFSSSSTRRPGPMSDSIRKLRRPRTTLTASASRTPSIFTASRFAIGA